MAGWHAGRDHDTSQGQLPAAQRRQLQRQGDDDGIPVAPWRLPRDHHDPERSGLARGAVHPDDALPARSAAAARVLSVHRQRREHLDRGAALPARSESEPDGRRHSSGRGARRGGDDLPGVPQRSRAGATRQRRRSRHEEAGGNLGGDAWHRRYFDRGADRRPGRAGCAGARSRGAGGAGRNAGHQDHAGAGQRLHAGRRRRQHHRFDRARRHPAGRHRHGGRRAVRPGGAAAARNCRDGVADAESLSRPALPEHAVWLGEPGPERDPGVTGAGQAGALHPRHQCRPGARRRQRTAGDAAEGFEDRRRHLPAVWDRARCHRHLA